ncbi:MAG: hypothetical protein SWH54_16400 [Thermodesulfobacteriota bacterium]|nr:hypothetical protein [Thermodesulfobacteriota bacterium]
MKIFRFSEVLLRGIGNSGDHKWRGGCFYCDSHLCRGKGSIPDFFFYGFDDAKADLICISNNGNVWHLHHGGIGIFIDGNDKMGISQGCGMLKGTADSK